MLVNYDKVINIIYEDKNRREEKKYYSHPPNPDATVFVLYFAYRTVCFIFPLVCLQEFSRRETFILRGYCVFQNPI